MLFKAVILFCLSSTSDAYVIPKFATLFTPAPFSHTTPPPARSATKNPRRKPPSARRVVILESVQNDTTTTTLTSSSKVIKSDKKEKKEPAAHTVLPFFPRVKWSSKNGLSNQWKTSSREAASATSTESKEKIASHGLPTRRVARSTPSQLPQPSGNHTNATATVPTNTNNTIFNRTHTTPIPVAESLLRSIYGQASESAKEMAAWSGNSVTEIPLWNMSQQFFPPTTPGGTGNQSLLAIAGKKSSDVITVEDLQRILLENGFVRQSDVAAALQRASLGATPATNLAVDTKPKQSLIEGLGQPVGDLFGGTVTAAPMPPSKSSSSSQVAFPQPSVLSYKSLKWGVTAASFLACTILAMSAMPSLWLMGGLVGSLYGYQTGQRLADGTVPKSFVPSFLIVFGRRITKSYLQVYDMVTALFFMYKTGQLSYSMWRKYADLDDRFQLQDKIDAWVRN